MIKINRGACPAALLRVPLVKSSYQDTEVQRTLLDMQFNKCAYCEKSLDQEMQIDHYRPQEEFVTGHDVVGNKLYNWDEANRWNNLLYACKDCNRAKTKESPFDTVTGERVIIDPTDPNIDPEDYIDFAAIEPYSPNVAVIIKEKYGKKLGSSTIEKLKLRRKKHLGKLQILCIKLYHDFAVLLLYLKNGMNLNHIDCQTKLSAIRMAMDARSPFAAFSRSFFTKILQSDELRAMGPEIERQIRDNITIPTGCSLP